MLDTTPETRDSPLRRLCRATGIAFSRLEIHPSGLRYNPAELVSRFEGRLAPGEASPEQILRVSSFTPTARGLCSCSTATTRAPTHPSSPVARDRRGPQTSPGLQGEQETRGLRMG
jgi:hypothetical protein